MTHSLRYIFIETIVALIVGADKGDLDKRLPVLRGTSAAKDQGWVSARAKNGYLPL